MRRSIPCIGTALACAMVVQPSTARAQVEWRGGTGATLEYYSFDKPTNVGIRAVSLLTIPAAVDVRLARQLDLRVSTAFARASMRRVQDDAPTVSLSGLTDTEVRLTYGIRNDLLRLSIVGLIPTGASSLTAGEMDVSGVVAADLLPFAISNWGAGGGIGASAALALPLGNRTAAGISGGYVVAREFEPIEETSFAYRPGDQLHFRAAIDRSIGASGKGSLQFVYQHFSSDRIAGENLYQAGDRLQVVGSFAFATGPTSSGVVYAGYLRRSEGEFTPVVTITPSQDLIYGGFAYRVPFSGYILLPALDGRVVGNADGVDQGYVLTASVGTEMSFGNARAVPRIGLRYGRLTIVSDRESGFTGIDLGFTMRAGTLR